MPGEEVANEDAADQAVAGDQNLPPAGQPVDEGNEISAVTGGATQLEGFTSAIPNVERKEGEVFYYQGDDGKLSLWQALEDTLSVENPSDNVDKFMEITDCRTVKLMKPRESFLILIVLQKVIRFITKANIIKHPKILSQWQTKLRKLLIGPFR